jgi:UDP-2,4-diacetamido-2,4,6-trideoxy-beta-L-altropyranose hydrolase
VAPRVSIRVDASARMGTGHLKRCLSLAETLQAAGASVDFLVRPIDGVAAQVLSGSAWPVHWLSAPEGGATQPWEPSPGDPPHALWAAVDWQQDAIETTSALQDSPPTWLVLDHYAFDARWHRRVSQGLGARLLVIDDTADRAIDADALLDHNWAADHRAKYAGRLAREPRWLAGPRFALLGAAYRDACKYSVRPEVRSIGIFMGGTDPEGISAQVLTACREAGFGGEIEVASTSVNPRLAALRAACVTSPPAHLLLDAPDLAGFFARHDLQIGAGGGATWERCCIGAPTVALALAANQTATVPALASLGAVRAASLPGTVLTSDPPLRNVLTELLHDAAARASLAEHAAALVDGRGAERVALFLLGPSLQVRSASAEDAEQLYRWRNHQAVRAVSGQGEPIAWAKHLAWLEGVLASPNRHLFVGQVGDLPVGSIRFDRVATGETEVSLYLDPDLQGLGLGPHLLQAGEQAVCLQLGAALTLQASVLPGNRASQRLFEGNGYHGGPLRYSKTVDHLSGPCP